jgi:hypothetical protein
MKKTLSNADRYSAHSRFAFAVINRTTVRVANRPTFTASRWVAEIQQREEPDAREPANAKSGQ